MTFTSGESFGKDKAQQTLQGIATYLQERVDAINVSQAAGQQVGLIAQRMPSLTWREARQDDKGYAISDIDTVTGQQSYPYLRFDDTGVPFSSHPALWQPDPLDPGIRVRFELQLTQSALRRKAIAAQWEVDTARIQQGEGDPNAGHANVEHPIAMHSIAAYAIFYWAGGVNNYQSRAENDDMWRKAA